MMRVLLGVAAIWTSVAARPEPAPSELVEQARLMESVAALPAARAARGDESSRRGLVDAEELILARLREMGHAPATQDVEYTFTPRRKDAAPIKSTYRNIIVDMPGSEEPNAVIIVGAHLDAVPGSPGADDNGTGVAALLEMARVLKDRRHQRTIRLVFFTLEEVGLVGSTTYAASLQEAVRARELTILGMVSLDMLGYFSDEADSQRSPVPAIPGVFEPPTRADFIGLGGILKHRAFSAAWAREMVRASPELKVVAVDFLPVPPPDLLRSDHAPFLGLLDAPAIILSDTANFRSPHYHRATDTIETIDAERFTAVVRGVVGATFSLARPTRIEVVPESP